MKKDIIELYRAVKDGNADYIYIFNLVHNRTLKFNVKDYSTISLDESALTIRKCRRGYNGVILHDDGSATLYRAFDSLQDYHVWATSRNELDIEITKAFNKARDEAVDALNRPMLIDDPHDYVIRHFNTGIGKLKEKIFKRIIVACRGGY